MEEVKYACEFSQNSMSFAYDPDKELAIMQDHRVDFDQPRLMFLMIRNLWKTLRDKGCKRVTMGVTKKDWDDFLRKETKWELVEGSLSVYRDYETEQLVETVMVHIGVDEFVDAFSSGVGFKE